MHASRFRVRWKSGIAFEALTYGSTTYGTGTYGQTASALTGMRYEMIPWTAGQPISPSWMYRSGDTKPDFRARILSDDAPADLAAVSTIDIVLTPIDGRDRSHELVYAGAIVPSIKGCVTRVWQPGDLAFHGTYRPLVRIGFASSDRYLTITADDRHTFAILDERSTL